MEYYNIDKLGVDITSWLNTRYMQEITAVNGGWEYWVQIDFVGFIDNLYQEQFDFQREVKFGNSRADWGINMSSEKPVLVEIKCQSHRLDNDSFVRAVNRDIEKLRYFDNQITKLVLAGVIDQDAAGLLSQRGFIRIDQTSDIGIGFFSYHVSSN